MGSIFYILFSQKWPQTIYFGNFPFFLNKIFMFRKILSKTLTSNERAKLSSTLSVNWWYGNGVGDNNGEC